MAALTWPLSARRSPPGDVAAAGATAARPAAVTVDNLTISYRQHPAVHHLSCRFDAGTLSAIVGPNGAGKSSLLDALVGRVAPATGRVELGVPGRSRVAYLPQQNQIDRSFPLRVSDVVMLGAWPSLGLFGGASASVRQRAAAALEQVGLSGLAHRLVGELSVGQFQRVLFARVLLQDAPLILLDEPFNAIDTRTTADLLALVHRWHGEGRTVLAVLHDLDQVRMHFPQTLLLAREAIAFGPSREVLTEVNLRRARDMAERWDDAAAWCHRDEAPSAELVASLAHAHGHAHPHLHDHTHAPVHGHRDHGHGVANVAPAAAGSAADQPIR